MKKGSRIEPACTKEIEMTMTKQQGFTLVELLVVIGILGILSAALFPAIGNAVLKANMMAVSTRGKDIYVAVVGANTEREPLGLGNIWPKNAAGVAAAGGAAGAQADIATTPYTSSSDYFADLLDANNYGGNNWAPYVQGLDFSKLSGSGVPARPSGGGQGLQPANNMWTICANLRDELEDVIPFLVTRNVNTQILRDDVTNPTEDRIETGNWFEGGPDRTQPFSNKGFVFVRKGGGTFTLTARYVSLKTIYQGQSFITSTGTAIAYLVP
jgi:prepilin-type N-terminal cleavage/methylation domain-containing protein